MHHVAGMINDRMALISNGIVALLFVGALGLPALLAVDDQHRTFNTPEKFEGLARIERLRRGRAMQRIELPNPFATVVLFHRGASEIEGRRIIQPRIGLLQLTRARCDAGIFPKMAASTLVHFSDPL